MLLLLQRKSGYNCPPPRPSGFALIWHVLSGCRDPQGQPFRDLLECKPHCRETIWVPSFAQSPPAPPSRFWMNTGCQLVEAAAAERGGLRGLGPEGGRAAAQPAFRRCSGSYTHTTKTQKHPPTTTLLCLLGKWRSAGGREHLPVPLLSALWARPRKAPRLGATWYHLLPEEDTPTLHSPLA